MNISISLDNIDTMIQDLAEIARKIEEFPSVIANEAKENVQYNEAVTDVDEGIGIHTITTTGDQVAFQEFGAGFVAQTVDIGDFHTEPGIYSGTEGLGKGTFQTHQALIAQGKASESDYRYNRMPQMKFQNEVERLRTTTEQRAKEYFA